jgi:transposase-like protein
MSAGESADKQARRPLAVDEVFLRITGHSRYLWRVIDQDGEVIDILLLARRDPTRHRTVLPATSCAGKEESRCGSSPTD